MSGPYDQAFEVFGLLSKALKGENGFKGNYQTMMATYDSPLTTDPKDFRWAYGFLTSENEEAEAKAFVEKHQDFKAKTIKDVSVLQT
eukprot:CAMPEP_0114599002 /NCGR_PEP_ID=MMETSP0125-20121206/21448_1 /TAXON_ID=485358 ORGANISM="Aristerostoma sp., Strain ATCC 50986" /NCGR_SAMPLE_ID=MMETSP0125 /ASSEMBLY_ACC=CAM_ASM_000245 /LENGTH=86 /DNA_ID=CAMNT_0001805449 /DNA_START=12 /DNA_END=272 /DNA_ORIENTATION=-